MRKKTNLKFVMAPIGLLQHDIRTALVFGYMWNFRDGDGFFNGKNEQISKYTGIGKTKVKEVVKRMEDVGWVRVFLDNKNHKRIVQFINQSKIENDIKTLEPKSKTVTTEKSKNVNILDFTEAKNDQERGRPATPLKDKKLCKKGPEGGRPATPPRSPGDPTPVARRPHSPPQKVDSDCKFSEKNDTKKMLKNLYKNKCKSNYVVISAAQEITEDAKSDFKVELLTPNSKTKKIIKRKKETIKKVIPKDLDDKKILTPVKITKCLSKTNEENKKIKKAPDPRWMEINSVLGLFIEHLGLIDPFSNRTMRGAAKSLLETYGFEKLKEMVLAVKVTNKIPYAPIITDPVTMKHSWSKLTFFMSQQQNKQVDQKLINKFSHLRESMGG